jgi:hypothetical protein
MRKGGKVAEQKYKFCSNHSKEWYTNICGKPLFKNVDLLKAFFLMLIFTVSVREVVSTTSFLHLVRAMASET